MSPTFKKTLKRLTLVAVLAVLVAILWANYTINSYSQDKIYSDTSHIPANNVGLLLGTSKHLSSGAPNQYFYHRIEAAVKLYQAGKIKAIVVSGDNSQKNYNEPQDMKDELVKAGIPAERIYLDYAGFRTHDSVMRMQHIFGQQAFTIISQEFHNQRAIYIAHTLRLNAIGFNAENVSAYNGFKTQVREKFARVKVFVDQIVGKEAKYLGEPIEIKL